MGFEVFFKVVLGTGFYRAIEESRVLHKPSLISGSQNHSYRVTVGGILQAGTGSLTQTC